MDINENIALSFIYSYECLAVWKYICNTFDIEAEEDEMDLVTMTKDEIEAITEYLTKSDYYEEEKKNVLYNFTNKVRLIF